MIGNSKRILKFCDGSIKECKINLEKNTDNKKPSMKSADEIVTKTSFSSRVCKEIPIFTQ